MSASEVSAVTVLDGETLRLEDLVRVARDPGARVDVAKDAVGRVRAGREVICKIVDDYRAALDQGKNPVQDYGVTTGFGEFKNIPIPPDDLERLQQNLLRSHSVGVGDNADADDPVNYFKADVVRATLLIRLNAFLKGHSGVRLELVETVRRMLHRGIVPLVPTRGSLGSSGDLCPLAHLFAVLVGEGRYYLVAAPQDLETRPGDFRAAAGLASDLGAEPVAPSFKEGLALINGATLSTAVLALAVHDAAVLAATADVAGALTMEAICGCARAFDPKVHAARGHPGQIDSAANFRSLVDGSRLVDSADEVQDPYSVRCAPVVHGATRDAIVYVRGVVEREINAATDNPLFFPEAAEAPWGRAFAANWPPGFEDGARQSYSAGNFHGQPIALAADFLAIAAAELANVAERRVQMLLDHHHNRNLPANLVADRGVNSGYMLAQYCAASLVSENKILTHPASVDSIPTGANIEDHVAMATTAARKLQAVLANVEAVLAIELLVAAQAVEWRAGMRYAPVLRHLPGPDREVAASEEPVPAERGLDRVADEAERFARASAAERRPEIAARLGSGTAAAYLAVRDVAGPVVADRVLDGDIRSVRRLIQRGELLARVGGSLARPLIRPKVAGV